MSLTKDAKLYEELNKIYSRFMTMERLEEVGHGYDTQINESYNNTASWFAPKNKVYCGSQSLKNRLSVAIGINSTTSSDSSMRLEWQCLNVSITSLPSNKSYEQGNRPRGKSATRKLNASRSIMITSDSRNERPKYGRGWR
jgi:hypothetical protein